MIPDYNPAFDWSINIEDLANKLASVLRERTKTRGTIEPFPATNVPSLVEANQQALANFDKDTQTIEWQAAAARDGYYFFDEDTLRTPTVALDRKSQTWRREASKRGRILRPAEYIKSIRSAVDTPPLMVRRAPAGYKFPEADPESGRSRV